MRAIIIDVGREDQTERIAMRLSEEATDALDR